MIDDWENAIVKYKNSMTNHFSDDPHMMKTCRNDIRDLKKGLSLFKKGKYTEAKGYVNLLDTLVRELIPNSCWDFMTVLCEKHH